jgi:hypothetical protein
MSRDLTSCRGGARCAAEHLRARFAEAVGDRVPVALPIGDRLVCAAAFDGVLAAVLCMSPAGAAGLDGEHRAALQDLGFQPDGPGAHSWWRAVRLDDAEGSGARRTDPVQVLAQDVVAALTGPLAVPVEVVSADVRRTPPVGRSGPDGFRPAVDDRGRILAPADLDLDYGAHLLAAMAGPGPLWVGTVAPIYAAIVDAADLGSVRELVALAAGPGGGAAWYRRTRFGWTIDPTVRRRIVERGAHVDAAPEECLMLLRPDDAQALEAGLRFDLAEPGAVPVGDRRGHGRAAGGGVR